MEKTNIKGVYKIAEGQFCYRLMIERKGMKKIDTTCRKDENGNPFTTKTAAQRALEKKRLEVLGNPVKIKNKGDKTFSEIYELYLLNGTSRKAKSTIRKQKSMWENHIKNRFGNIVINEITVGEINDYLTNLYIYGDEYNKFSCGYAYKYVEGFLKFFYLLLNYAYAYESLDGEKYTRMLVNKQTRIRMPELRQEDLDEDGEYYDNKTIEKIWKIVKGGNFEIPFLLGYTLGTRISETFCLRWSNINWLNNSITIDGQLLYDEGVWTISSVKTLQAVRTIHMPKNLVIRLKQELWRQEAEKDKPSWRATERVIDVRERNNHKEIVGGDFICRKENGELMTTNSRSYWVKKIKSELGLDFHFHSLRKTHLTNLANLNTPILEFQLRSGHKKIETAQKFYINQNALAQKILKDNVESISSLSGLHTSLADGIISTEISPDDFKKLKR